MGIAVASRYSPRIQAILEEERMMPLGPGVPDLNMKLLLHDLTPENCFPRVVDRNMAQLAICGLWIRHDFLEESHEISQTIKNASGSYWHAIMHRREPDSYNAKYWFRQVGKHPAIKTLSDKLRRVYDPLEAVDLIETHRDTGSPEEAQLLQIQKREWECLFDFCCLKAANA
jgi:hypothetical protein